MSNPLFDTKVIVRKFNRATDGQARVMVRWNGFIEEVPFDYSASDPYEAALREVFGNVKMTYQQSQVFGRGGVIRHYIINPSKD